MGSGEKVEQTGEEGGAAAGAWQWWRVDLSNPMAAGMPEHYAWFR